MSEAGICVLQLKALSCPGLHMEYAKGQIFPLLVPVIAPPMVMGIGELRQHVKRCDGQTAGISVLPHFVHSSSS